MQKPPAVGPSNETSNRPAAKKVKKEKRFYCSYCDRYFARLEHLQRHSRTHTRERPFICQFCSQDFSRSDLLVRHHRLVHREDEPNGTQAVEEKKSPILEQTIVKDVQIQDTHYRHFQTTPAVNCNAPFLSLAAESPAIDHESNIPLQTLSAAVDYAAALELLASHPQHSKYGRVTFDMDNVQPESTPNMPNDVLMDSQNTEMDFDAYLNSLAWSLEDEPFSGHNFSSFIGADQPMPLFSLDVNRTQQEQLQEQEPEPGRAGGDDINGLPAEQSQSFSRFGSRLPSLQPEDGHQLSDDASHRRRSFYDVSTQERQHLQDQLGIFASVVPAGFALPSCLALNRYIAGYVNGFHDHLPFLHVTTASVANYRVELTLAIAAVGSQYCYEHEKGVELFRTSLAIAHERVRRRDMLLVSQHESMEKPGSASSRPNLANSSPESLVPGPLGLPQGHGTSSAPACLMQTAQALLLLMAMATWAKHKVIFREALAIQSILATIIRDDGLEDAQEPQDIGWYDWIRLENAKRTKFMVYCFFNLHCIVYNIPPLILSSEIRMSLPCSGDEFRASDEAEWRNIRENSKSPSKFQDCFLTLFTRHDKDSSRPYNTSLGNYILIHALIQQIFFVRQTAQCRPGSYGELTADETSSLEGALRNWQRGWKLNPESSLDPLNPNGRVAFNSTALLRLAYIRLNVDLGPLRGLGTRDPTQIARMFQESPKIRRTPRLVRAILHCAHALSIPIKLGIGLVARTQTFFWSIQHSLCSLECAFLLSKWLSAVAEPDPKPEISRDERRIVALVKTMLDETEFAIHDVKDDGADESIDHSPAKIKQLSAGVLKVWAKIFKGSSTWAIVDIIGSSLNIYAELLGSS